MEPIRTLQDLERLKTATLTVARLKENKHGSPELRLDLARVFATWTGWPAASVEAEDRSLLPSLFETAWRRMESEGLELRVSSGDLMPAGGMDLGGGYAIVTRSTIVAHDFSLVGKAA